MKVVSSPDFGSKGPAGGGIQFMTVKGFIVQNLLLSLFYLLGTVNPPYSDNICSQRHCHQNEFAVVQNTYVQINM